MPLHDWSTSDGWEGMHVFWLTALARQLRHALPPGYRAYIGSAPAVAIGSPPRKPDVAVERRGGTPEDGVPAGGAREGAAGTVGEPEVEVAVATLETAPTLFVERKSRLVAALELISPRNKDRPSSRTASVRRYAAYLLDGVHLLVVDVHPRPHGFSLADGIDAELAVPERRLLPPPLTVAYRVGEEAPDGGKYLAIWRNALRAGEPLPPMPLPLTVHEAVTVDLEGTYAAAAADAYLT